MLIPLKPSSFRSRLKTLHGLPTSPWFHSLQADLRVMDSGFLIFLSSVSLIPSSIHNPGPCSNVTSQTQITILCFCSGSHFFIPETSFFVTSANKSSPCKRYLLPLAWLATSTRSEFSLLWCLWHFGPFLVYFSSFPFSFLFLLLFFLLGNLTINFITLEII